MCDHPGSECGRNGCGHTFCNTCWQSHLAVQIKEGKARHISCMAFKCGVVCDEELVLKVIQVRVSGGACGSVGRSLVNKAGGAGGTPACLSLCVPSTGAEHGLFGPGGHACMHLRHGFSAVVLVPSCRVTSHCSTSTSRATWRATWRTTSGSPSALVCPGVAGPSRCVDSCSQHRGFWWSGRLHTVHSMHALRSNSSSSSRHGGALCQPQPGRQLLTEPCRLVAAPGGQ